MVVAALLASLLNRRWRRRASAQRRHALTGAPPSPLPRPAILQQLCHLRCRLPQMQPPSQQRQQMPQQLPRVAAPTGLTSTRRRSHPPHTRICPRTLRLLTPLLLLLLFLLQLLLLIPPLLLLLLQLCLLLLHMLVRARQTRPGMLPATAQCDDW